MTRSQQRLALTAIGLFALAVVLRGYNLYSAYDVFVDEITYLRLGERLLEHGDVQLYGKPFYLHPPGFFFLEAAYLAVVRPTGYVIDVVLQLRWLNILLAGISTVLVWQLVRRLATPTAGIVAALVFALDPFVIRISSRVLIETSAMMWILAGFVLLLPVLEREEDSRLPADTWTAALRSVAFGSIPVAALGAGLCFGFALLSKDQTAFLTLAPFGIAAVISTVQRRTALAAIITTAVVYLPYPLVAALRGDLEAFLDAKGTGVLRLLGQVQLTGFNAEGSVSFTQRIIERLGTFGATYVLIALGGLAATTMIVRGGRSRRLLGVWAMSTYLLAAYSVVRGTLEEQLFYYLVVPSIVVMTISASDLHRAVRPRARPASTTVIAMSLVAFLTFGASGWVRIHRTHDDAHLRLRDHLLAEVPLDEVIGTTSDVGTFALDPFDTFPVRDAESLQNSSLSWVVLSTKSVEDGTVDASDALVELVTSRGDVAYEVDGESVGTLRLYRVDDVTRAGS